MKNLKRLKRYILLGAVCTAYAGAMFFVRTRIDDPGYPPLPDSPAVTSSAETEFTTADEHRSVYISAKGKSKIYHYKRDCSGMKNAEEVQLDEISGYEPCKKCVK